MRERIMAELEAIEAEHGPEAARKAASEMLQGVLAFWIARFGVPGTFETLAHMLNLVRGRVAAKD